MMSERVTRSELDAAAEGGLAALPIVMRNQPYVAAAALALDAQKIYDSVGLAPRGSRGEKGQQKAAWAARCV